MTCLKEGLKHLSNVRVKVPTLVHLKLVSCDVLDKTKINLGQLCEVFVLVRIHTISWMFDKGVLYVKRTVGVLKVLKVSRNNQE